MPRKNLIDQVLPEQAADPSTPGAGLLDLYAKGDHGLWIKDSNGVVSKIGPKAVTLAAPQATVSTTNTAILVAAIPAGSVKVGDQFELDCFGISSSTGILTFKAHAGPTGTAAGGVPADAAAWTSIASAAQVANQRAGFRARLTVRSIGVGTIQCEGLGYAQAALLPTVVAAVGTVAVTTTGVWRITIACTCSVGTWTAQQAVISAV